MKKKVIVINYMGRHGSGNIHAYLMAKALIEEGKNVVAVVSKYAENIQLWRQLNLTELVEVETYQSVIQFAYRSIIFYLLKSKRIALHLKDRYDISAVYNPMLTYWTLGLNRHLKNNKIISCNHDPIPHSGDRKKWTFQKELEESDVIIVHSRIFLDYVKKMYKDKQVEYMPLSRLSVYDLPNKQKIVNYDSQKVNFLFFGTISKYKGLEILAQAYAKLTDEVDNVTLTIAGKGDFSPYNAAYEKVKEKDVTIINRWILDEEVEGFFIGENIVLVAPYIDATQSGPIQLALEHGHPVIASNTGGLSEQIQDGKNGLLIKPANVSELVEAMRIMATNKEMLRYMNENIQRNNNTNNDKYMARRLIEIIIGEENRYGA